jgi:N-acetyltransferase
VTGNGFHPPVVLEGLRVRLVPLSREHIPELARAGRDPEIWRYLRIGPGRTLEEMTALVEFHLREQEKGTVLPFTVRVRPDGRVAGIVRYLEIDRENLSVEIGTWLDPAFWRSPVNTELKLLTMRYAFEDEGVHRFQLKTDVRNERSQRAIERLGAQREGTVREHILRPDGEYRSSIYYSLLASEWPAARARLEAMLARPWSGSPERPAPWWA